MKKSILITAAIFAFCILVTANCFSQGTAINNTGSAADNSAMLDVSSNTKGLLMPRMTSGERNSIVSPAVGLIIFNISTNCFEAYVNGAWNIVSCPAACTPPAVPAAASATNVGCTDFTANWASSNGANQYFIDVSTDAGFGSFVSGFNNLGVGNITSYQVTGLTPGSYYYRVRAAAGCTSSNSNTTGPVVLTANPSSPAEGTHTPSYTQVIWNWNTVSGATGYKWNTVNDYNSATDMGTNTSKTETGLNCYTAYTRYVWAYNSCGVSSATTLSQTTLGSPISGLMAYYPFTGNANDAGPNSYHGTVYGASLTTDRFGVSDKAYYYDAVNDYIQSPASFPTGSSSKSFSVWFNPTNKERGWIIAGGADVDGQAFGLFITDAGGDVLFHGNGPVADMVIFNISQINTWYHVAVTYDGSTVKAYVNGVFTASKPNSLNTANANIKFGSRQNGQPDEFYLGKIDEIGIWDKALSDSEVMQVYQGCIQ